MVLRESRQIVTARNHLRLRMRGIDLVEPVDQTKPLGAGVSTALLVARHEQSYEIGADGDLRKFQKVGL